MIHIKQGTTEEEALMCPHGHKCKRDIDREIKCRHRGFHPHNSRCHVACVGLKTTCTVIGKYETRKTLVLFRQGGEMI